MSLGPAAGAPSVGVSAATATPLPISSQAVKLASIHTTGSVLVWGARGAASCLCWLRLAVVVLSSFSLSFSLSLVSLCSCASLLLRLSAAPRVKEHCLPIWLACCLAALQHDGL
jgi:hypothetical protein